MNDFYIPECTHPLLLVNQQALTDISLGGTLYFDDKPFYFPSFVNDYPLGKLFSLVYGKPVEEIARYVVHRDGFPSNYLFQYVPCSKCSLCRHKKQTDLVNRCTLESLCYDCPPYFFTLTYDNEHLPYHSELIYEDFQKFLKRLRIRWSRSGLNHSIRYVVSGEYGSNPHRGHRPHFHFIMYNNPYKANESVPQLHYKLADDVFKAWSNCQKSGFDFGQCAGGAASYVAKYLSKPSLTYGRYHKPFVRSSIGNGGIGYPYIKSMMDYYRSNPSIREFSFIDSTGVLRTIPFGTYLTQHIWPSPVRTVPSSVKSDYKMLCDVLIMMVRYNMLRYKDAYNLSEILRPYKSIVRNKMSYKDTKLIPPQPLSCQWYAKLLLQKHFVRLSSRLSVIDDVDKDYLSLYIKYKQTTPPSLPPDYAYRLMRINQTIEERKLHEIL